MKKNKNKQILIVSTVHMDRNGITTVIMNYYRELVKENSFYFDFIVNDYIDPEIKNEVESKGSTVYIVERKRKPIGYLMYLDRLLKRKHYDIIHVHGNSATMGLELKIAKMNQIPLRIAHCHNSTCDNLFLHRILLPLLNSSMNCAIACSKKAGGWIFKNRYEILQNGINAVDYKYNELIRKQLRKELNIENQFVIGHIGAFNEQKNHEKLFGIVAELIRYKQNVKIICISGDIDTPNYIYDLIDNYKLKTNTILLNNRKDVNKLLMAMDCFVFPSKWEGLGIACIEAEASGLPCYVSNMVPIDVDITEHVFHIGLDVSNYEWAKRINSQSYIKIDREKAYTAIDNSCFSLNKNISTLINIYSCI